MMNKKHLLWYVYEFLENKDLIQDLKDYCEGRTFSEVPSPAEIAVKAAIDESYKSYLEAKRKENE